MKSNIYYLNKIESVFGEYLRELLKEEPIDIKRLSEIAEDHLATTLVCDEYSKVLYDLKSQYFTLSLRELLIAQYLRALHLAPYLRVLHLAQYKYEDGIKHFSEKKLDRFCKKFKLSNFKDKLSNLPDIANNLYVSGYRDHIINSFLMYYYYFEFDCESFVIDIGNNSIDCVRKYFIQQIFDAHNHNGKKIKTDFLKKIKEEKWGIVSLIDLSKCSQDEIYVDINVLYRIFDERPIVIKDYKYNKEEEEKPKHITNSLITIYGVSLIFIGLFGLTLYGLSKLIRWLFI